MVKNRYTSPLRKQLPLLIIAVLLIFGAFDGTAQKLRYQVKQKSLSAVLKQLSTETSTKIAYDTERTGDVMVSGTFKAKTIDELLSKILAETSLEVVKVDNVLIVKPKPTLSLPATINPIELPRYTVWGVVTDKESGERLPYAYVYSEKAKVAATANSEGYFTLTVNSQDSLYLNISYLGFDKKLVAIKPQHAPITLRIELARIQTVLGSVIVAKRQNNLVQLPVGVGALTLNPHTTATVPAINPLDFTPSLQMLPGIDGTTESAIGLNIRKSPADKTQILFDGFTVYHLNHFLGQLSAFNTKAIKNIRIFKGGFDARYGGAASAIIEITGKSGNRYRPSFSVGADLISVDGSAEMPIGKKWSLAFSARRSYTDLYKTSLYDKLFSKLRNDLEQRSLRNISSYNDKYTPKYHFYDIHSKLSYFLDTTTTLSLTFYAGNDNMDLLSEMPRSYLSENSQINNGGVGLSSSKQLSNGDFLSLSFGYSRYSLDFNHLNWNLFPKANAEAARRKNSLTNHINDFSANIEYEHRFTKWLSTVAGGVVKAASSGYAFNNYRSVLGNIEVDTLRQASTNGTIATGYVLLNISSGRIKSITPGVRISYFTPNKKLYVEPRIQLAYEIANSTTLKFAAGRYIQLINQIPISYLDSYNSYWAIADSKTYPAVASNHYAAGVTLDLNKNFQVDIEGYRKTTTGYAALVTLPLIKNGNLAFRQAMTYSSAYVNGIDVLAKYLLTNGQISLAYTLSDAFVHSKSLKVDPDYPSALNQLHEFKAFISHKFGRFNLSAAWIYGSGKPWDEMILLNNLRPAPEYERNSRVLSPYHRLDVSVLYKQPIGSTALSAAINFFNVYNHNNHLYRNYGWSSTPIQDFNSGKSPLQYSDIWGFGFTPTIYVNLSF